MKRISSQIVKVKFKNLKIIRGMSTCALYTLGFIIIFRTTLQYSWRTIPRVLECLQFAGLRHMISFSIYNVLY